jgi:hypothetical protein
MMTGIPEGIVAIILSAIGIVAWWGIKRIVGGQDEINRTLHQISDRLASINGRVGKMETRQEMHEKHDDERHEQFEKETADLWAAVRGR